MYREARLLESGAQRNAAALTRVVAAMLQTPRRYFAASTRRESSTSKYANGYWFVGLYLNPTSHGWTITFSIRYASITHGA